MTAKTVQLDAIRADELLPKAALCRRLGWGKHTLSKARRAGLGPWLRYGRGVYIRGRDVLSFFDQLTKQSARSILQEASAEEGDGRRKAIVKFALQSESATKRAAMLNLARSEPGIPVRPSGLDQNSWALNCRNGTIDLRTGNLRPHRREDHITKLCSVAYEPDATCPLWLKFQDQICDGHESLVTFKQRFYGYCLTADVSEQVLLILYGGGANGKSTEVNTFLRLLGEDYTIKGPG